MRIRNTIISSILIVLIGVSCKTETAKKTNSSEETTLEETTNVSKTDSLPLNSNEVKISPIKERMDDVEGTTSYLQNKRFLKESESYIVDFCYPYLDEKINNKFAKFNAQVRDSILQLSEIEKHYAEPEELLCDTLSTKLVRAHRIVDYKVFLHNQQDLSVLFYLENHYAHTKAAYYTFKTINFNLKEGKLLTFNDFFESDSVEEVLDIINIEISTSIRNGDLFYECFTVTLEDFQSAKNDFVIKENQLVYYFNDCVMCPSFVGTYEIEIPLERFIPVLKKQATQYIKT